MDDALTKRADRLLADAKRAGLTLAVAESCTGGLLCQVLSDAEGASAQFAGGFVTYTKAQKTAALGVPASLLKEKTAVCPEVARAMADGALRMSAASVTAAITGVAGPEPDEDDNPVGMVCLAVARRGNPTRDFKFNYGNRGRDAIRRQAVLDALDALIDAVTAVSAAA
jgi:nicotinamide-nucleotide amidase